MLVTFDGVATEMMPSSAQVLLPDQGDKAQVLQLRTQPPVGEQQMLRAMIGQTVTLLTQAADGTTQRRPMTVVRVDPSVMLQDDNGVLFDIPGTIEFPAIPSSLSPTPRLSALISGLPKGEQTVPATLRYITGGLSWQADHVVSLDADQEHLTLTTWATVTNTSGTVWSDAHLALVAGTVNNAVPRPEMMVQAAPMMASRGKASDAFVPPQAQASNGYYLYALPQAVSLEDGETRQVALGTPQQRPAELVYRVYASLSPHGPRGGEQDNAAAMILRFNTAKDGQPLPSGTMRVYSTAKTDTKESLLLGAGSVQATPAGQTVSLPLGEAFDITATQSQTDFRKVADQVTESAYRVVLHNGQDKDVTIQVLASPSGDWKIIEESRDHEKTSSTDVRWLVPVKAGHEVTLTYRIRTSF
jgi:adhesin HecA-like repeat protein